MNPESRIKLIRQLEELREYESNTYQSRFSRIFNWTGGALLILVSMLAGSSSIVNIKENPVIIFFWILPVMIHILWYYFHKKINANFTLLASTILELGDATKELTGQIPDDRIEATGRRRKQTKKSAKK